MKLVVSGINENIGPGDIVGAFINEVGIDGDDIGKIDIVENKAEVDINDRVVTKVIAKMNNNRVGGIKVSVFPKDKEKLINKKVSTYVTKFKKLVERERIAEMEQHELEIKRLSPRQREEKGRAILHLKGRAAGKAYGNKPLIKFIRQQPGEKLPETEISVGDLVMLGKDNPLAENNPAGTVAEKSRYSLTVVFDKQPPSFLYGKGLRLDLYVNDITYQRMLAAITRVKEPGDLRDKLLGLEALERREGQLPPIAWVNSKLDQSQKKAVKETLKARDFYLIQGPPGTGKTMTAIEIINQGIKKGISILAAADSNIAVDNLVERLANCGVEVLRVGHPLRVTPVLREHTLDYRVLKHPDYKQAQGLRDKVAQLLKQQDNLTHPGGRWRRGMSDQLIRKLARNNSGNRGVPPKKIKEMVRWLEVQDQINKFFARIDKLEGKAARDLIVGAEVVCATNSTSGSELMGEHKFDLVVIDEATQATEPGALISLVKGSKVVLIGDHKQLPPTVLNQEAAAAGLSKSLFERLYELYSKDFCSFLQVQYRMHDKIMNFSNQQFYQGKLVSASGVKNHTLAGLNIVPEDAACFSDKALVPEFPVVFLDTSRMEATESSRGDSYSYDNPVEAEIVLDIVDKVVRMGLEPTQIAVITPYRDQVNHLNSLNNLDNLEINTVDGFQGREKELVINSFVRSNPRQNIGFLRDLRRLNVALTRARRKLILIGDSQTICGHQLYADLLKYVKKEGLFYIL